MQFTIPSKRRPFILSFDLSSLANQRLRIHAYDQQKPKRIFTDRNVDMSSGQGRRFDLKFPTSPESLVVNISGFSGNSDRSLKLSNEEVKPLRACLFTAFDSHTQDFIRFALTFAYNCQYWPTGVFDSRDNKFQIIYLDTIRDQAGRQLNTPARVQHVSGKIEVAKDKFAKYSIPMMLLILLHEYSHKWLNRKQGKRIDDEVAADLNALRIYLSLGYPHIDARLVFCYVFYNKETPENMRRLRIVEDYITQFEQGKVVPGCR